MIARPNIINKAGLEIKQNPKPQINKLELSMDSCRKFQQLQKNFHALSEIGKNLYAVNFQMKPLHFYMVPFVLRYLTKLTLGFLLNFDIWHFWELRVNAG